MRTALFIALVAVGLMVQAQVQFDYRASMTGSFNSGNLAPHYIMANRGGTVTQKNSTLASASLSHSMDTTTRLSWGAGVEVWGGYSSSLVYQRGRANDASNNPQSPATVWLQEGFLEGKYRSLYLTLGQKAHTSVLLNDKLSSGDMTMSNNARPLPGFRAGFVNFQSIPFTRGWVQILGEMGYYRTTDDNWLANHYNESNHFITTGSWVNYKNLYLRSNPTQRVVGTIGLQAACQFGGTRTKRENGVVTEVIEQRDNLGAFFKAVIPGAGKDVKGEEYYEGNHLGSLDLAVDIYLNNQDCVRAYYQSPWNDASGLGKLNGLDGLWGFEYRASKPGIVSGVVVEFIDITNQSGPIHWAPDDFEGTLVTSEATGADDYYNNYAFNGYQVAGLCMGSSMVPGTIYNTDGHMQFSDNLLKGVHAAVTGNITPHLGYRLMGSYRRSWGTPFLPRTEPAHSTSIMVEGAYSSRRVNGLNVKLQFAFDSGELVGNTHGTLINISYTGNFAFKKRK